MIKINWAGDPIRNGLASSQEKLQAYRRYKQMGS